MNLEIIQSPFDSHNNMLFKHIKCFLEDENIYSKSEQDYPYTDKLKKYKLRLSDCDKEVNILINTNQFLQFNGSSTNTTFEFYVNFAKGDNAITVVDRNDTTILYASLDVNCYNIHTFLAFTAKKFKEIWNHLYQAQSNIYINRNIVQDLDGDYITPENEFLRDFGTLLGTSRYSKFTDDEFIDFLNEIYIANRYGGTLKGLYKIQEALSEYIHRIDVLPLEEYYVQRRELYGKIYTDGTDKIKIRPAYVYNENAEWGLLPEYDSTTNSTLSVPTNWDSTGFSNQINYELESGFGDICNWVYTDNEIYTDGTNIGALIIKGIGVPYLNRVETEYTDIFINSEICIDTDGYYTGYENGLYVLLRKPNLDGTISVINIGDVDVSESSSYNEKYNLVSLGTVHLDEITSVSVSYNSYMRFNLLGKVERDSTTGYISKIYNTGTFGLDSYYLSYLDENYGAVIINVNVNKIIDNELKNIINVVIRNLLPAHIKYYVNYKLPAIWYFAGETNKSMIEIDNYYDYIDDTLIWSSPTIDGGYTLNDICFVSNTIGYIVTDEGYIFNTTDGGDSWSEFINDLTQPINRLKSVSGICVGVGDNGDIITSLDSGENWSEITYTPLSSINLNDVTINYSPSKRKYICYAVGDEGNIITSFDSGVTWSTIYILNGLTSYKSSIVTIDGVTMTDIGGHTVADINSNYEIVDIKNNVITVRASDILYGIWDSNGTIEFPDIANALSLVLEDVTYDNALGEIYFTVSLSEDFKAIDFKDYKTGLIVGDNGKIFYTNDAFITVKQIASGTSQNLYNVNMPDYNQAIVCGDNYVGRINNILRNNTSITKSIVSENAIYNRVYMKNVDWGYLVGENGLIMKTTNSGRGWTEILSETTENLNGLSFVGYNKLLVAGNNSELKMITTTDTLFYPEVTFNDLI